MLLNRLTTNQIFCQALKCLPILHRSSSVVAPFVLSFCLLWKPESQYSLTHRQQNSLPCEGKNVKSFSVCCLFGWLWGITLNGFSFHFDGFIYIFHVKLFSLSLSLFVSFLSSPCKCFTQKDVRKSFPFFFHRLNNNHVVIPYFLSVIIPIFDMLGIEFHEFASEICDK